MTERELKQLADLVADRVAGAAVPRILLTTGEAARALGMSADTFSRHVAPHIGCVRRGEGGRGKGRALRLYRVDDLEAWAQENASSVVDDLSQATAP